MIQQDVLSSILGTLVIGLFLSGLVWLVLHDLDNRRTKHLGNYLDKHKDDRNAYYKAEREFFKSEVQGCLLGLAVVPLFLIVLFSLFYAYCK